jgi:Cu+-exporting ATPase
MSTSEKQIQIKGMTCASCVGTVEKALKSIPGVTEVSVNLSSERATLVANPEPSNETIAEVIRLAGYEAVFSDFEDPMIQVRKERTQVIFSALFTLPLMHFFHLPFWIQFSLGAIVQLGFGLRFYVGSWHSLQNRRANMDLLVAIGTTSAFLLSFIGHHPYFESAASIITLVRLGKWLEIRAKAKTTRDLRSLEALKPALARVKMGEQVFEMPISGVRLKDKVVVLPGKRVPLDGVLLEGESECDESFLTGESQLIFKKPGDRVIGGSVNTIGNLVIEVTALNTETLLSRVIRLIESANSKKAPIQKTVDQVAAFFVPAVMVIAFFTLAGHWISTGSLTEEAFLRAISVLVIACPCALGLATPTAMMVGTGLAARKGILIRDPEVLEVAHRMKVIALDKTGTLTRGKPSLVEIQAENPERALGIAGALQAGSEHPLAKAILETIKGKGATSTKANGIKAIPGLGIEGIIEGTRYALGSMRLLQSIGVNPLAPSESGILATRTQSFMVNQD